MNAIIKPPKRRKLVQVRPVPSSGDHCWLYLRPEVRANGKLVLPAQQIVVLAE